MVLHIDIDAFFASVEALRNPRLRGKPVAVGSGCIASCSYEARRWGLRAGMPLSSARRLCPRLVVLQGDYRVYRAFAEQVWDIARGFSPAIETYLDDCYIDLAGTDLLHGPALEAARRLKTCVRERTGLAVTAGTGPNRTVARIASAAAKPDGLASVPTEDVDRVLVPLPVKRLPGAGPRTCAVLARLNIRTVGELRAIPREVLRTIFGRPGEALYDRARGRDSFVISEREIPRTISRETTLHSPTRSVAELDSTLSYLVERACGSARSLGLRAGAVELKVRYADFDQRTKSTALPSPSALDNDLLRVSRELFRKAHVRRAPVRHVGVTLARFTPKGGRGQLGLFEDDSARDMRLCGALDSLREKFGFASVMRASSHRLGRTLKRHRDGFFLRTPSLTK